MASIFTHAVAAAALGQAAPSEIRKEWRFWYLVLLCAVLPDIDVLGFHFGIHYGDLWGHRGLTHSLLFAVVIGAVAALRFRSIPGAKTDLRLGILLGLITASHGFLDAFTNGGLGVAFFSPFDPQRYFFPWTPVEVSPIGAARFFSARGWMVLKSELMWIWLPSFAVGLLLRFVSERCRLR